LTKKIKETYICRLNLLKTQMIHQDSKDLMNIKGDFRMQPKMIKVKQYFWPFHEKKLESKQKNIDAFFNELKTKRQQQEKASSVR